MLRGQGWRSTDLAGVSDLEETSTSIEDCASFISLLYGAVRAAGQQGGLPMGASAILIRCLRDCYRAEGLVIEPTAKRAWKCSTRLNRGVVVLSTRVRWLSG